MRVGVAPPHRRPGKRGLMRRTSSATGGFLPFPRRLTDWRPERDRPTSPRMKKALCIHDLPMAYDGELQNDPFCMHLRINVETPAAAHIGGYLEFISKKYR
jgi:hypothetical protein